MVYRRVNNKSKTQHNSLAKDRYSSYITTQSKENNHGYQYQYQYKYKYQHQPQPV